MNRDNNGGYVEFPEGKFVFKEGYGGWVKRSNIYPNSNKEHYTWINGDGEWILNNKNMYEWKPNKIKII
tara:strand:- start:176 stop:382 length:207 start_codon:yes stop_codon:yes gene_type:complete